MITVITATKRRSKKRLSKKLEVKIDQIWGQKRSTTKKVSPAQNLLLGTPLALKNYAINPVSAWSKILSIKR